MLKIKISDILFEIDVPLWAVHENLLSFVCEDDAIKADTHCSVLFADPPKFKPNDADFVVIDNNRALYKRKNQILQAACNKRGIPSFAVSDLNWTDIRLYINPRYNVVSGKNAKYVRENIYLYLKNVFLSLLAVRNGIMIHSVSIIRNEEGILFSAPAGTGKTTQADLWKQRYPDVRVLDGDETACRMIDGKPVAYGLPWCGSSGLYLNEKVPLRALVFLERAEENAIQKLEPAEAFLRLAARCFIHRWSEEQTALSLDTVQELAERTDCFLLRCLPNIGAVELLRNRLDDEYGQK